MAYTMKKVNLLLVAALSVVLWQSCGGQKDSKAQADSANKSKDTTTLPMAADSQKTGSAAIEVNQNDAKFATAALAGGMTEVALSKLAQQKATDARIKNFAAMMVTDHGKAGQELESLARKLRIDLPNALDNDGQKKLKDLTAKSGADFDKAYVSVMVSDHKDAAKLFEDGEKNCKDADLEKFAANTVVVIKKHLTEIEAIQKGMK